MKKYLLLTGFSLLFSLCCQAKIWRVNNNSGITADFNTIQAAHDGADGGDTIHLEGSPNSYGYLGCSKKLIIIGPGYFLNENQNLQALTLPAYLGGIDFNAGASGSEVMGVYFPGSAVSVNCNNIVIKRNNFATPNNDVLDWGVGYVTLNSDPDNSANGVSQIIISQNYGLQIQINYSSTGVLITNNYITKEAHQGDETEGLSLNSHPNAVAIVQNNIFRRGKVLVFNSGFSNNIMVNGLFPQLKDNLVSNNIASGNQFETDNGNKANVDMSTVFESTGSPDAYWKLKNGSPAKGAGFGSTNEKPIDCGMYGGQSPYVLSGIPPVPSVYFFANQPVGSSNDPIDVTVKVRSNN